MSFSCSRQPTLRCCDLTTIMLLYCACPESHLCCVCTCVWACLQESKKDYSMHIASQRTLEQGQVVLSTDNIFSRCRQKSHIAHPAETHPLQQLDIIANYVSDLMVLCKRPAPGSAASAQAVTPAAAR